MAAGFLIQNKIARICPKFKGLLQVAVEL